MTSASLSKNSKRKAFQLAFSLTNVQDVYSAVVVSAEQIQFKYYTLSSLLHFFSLQPDIWTLIFI